MTGNDNNDLIIGKEDGCIEIYTVDDNENAKFKKNFVSHGKYY